MLPDSAHSKCVDCVTMLAAILCGMWATMACGQPQRNTNKRPVNGPQRRLMMRQPGSAGSLASVDFIRMNKAFVKETDDSDDEDGEASLPQLPKGARNYMTPAGYQRLKAELLNLIDDERPKIVETVHWAAKNGDRSENGDYLYGKKRLREIDRRIRFLTKRLELAEVTDPSLHHGNEQVFFGATVTYVDDDDVERTVTIMGIDETDTGAGQVSWVSPIARTLLKSRVGDVLKLVTPVGVKEIEVLKVEYPAPAA